MTCVVLNVIRAVWLKAPFFRDTKQCHCVTGFLPSEGIAFPRGLKNRLGTDVVQYPRITEPSTRTWPEAQWCSFGEGTGEINEKLGQVNPSPGRDVNTSTAFFTLENIILPFLRLIFPFFKLIRELKSFINDPVHICLFVHYNVWNINLVNPLVLQTGSSVQISTSANRQSVMPTVFWYMALLCRVVTTFRRKRLLSSSGDKIKLNQ